MNGSTKTKIGIEICVSIISLFTGGMIYLAFRNDSLLMFRWADNLGFHDVIYSMREATKTMYIPNFIKSCLPDGLWSISYILIVDAVVDNHTILWAISLPLIALLLEILQGFRIIGGVFDWGDVLCYVIPLLIFVIIKLSHNEKDC